MPPPPATAAALRSRPLTLTLLGAQLARDFEHNAAAKAQNARIEAVFNRIGNITREIESLESQARSMNLQAHDALVQQDPMKAMSLLGRQAGIIDRLGELRVKLATATQEGLAIEAEDVDREAQRGHENGVRNDQIRAWRREERRVERPYRPGPDGVA